MNKFIRSGGMTLLVAVVVASASLFVSLVAPTKVSARVSSQYWTRLFVGVGGYGTASRPLEGIYACKKTVLSSYGPLWLVRSRIRQVAPPYSALVSYSGYTQKTIRNGSTVSSYTNNYWFEQPDYQDFTNYWEGRSELYASQLLGDTSRITAVAGYGSGLSSVTINFNPKYIVNCSDAQTY